MRTNPSRRSLLHALLASPLLVAAAPVAAFEQLLAAVGQGAASADEAREIIEAASEAIDVFDFDRVAERNLTPAHYTFLSMGVQHEVTLRANRSAFDDVQLRPRRLVDVRNIDTQTEILGAKMPCPIILAPMGSQEALHPEGELAVARAARSRDQLQILSTASSYPLEKVIDARGAPLWFQLYTADVWPVTQRQIRQAEDAGCTAIALTVDNMSVMFGQNRDRMRRYRRNENPTCRTCHQSHLVDALDTADRVAQRLGIGLGEWLENMLILDWDNVKRIRDATAGKLLIKGIVTREDASLCIQHGVDGIIVSNHGGRALDTGLSTIEALPPIVEEVAGRIPVLVDSGFRRGTDIYKALALGADAVCIGRPYGWGLAAFGQAGVEAVLDMLRREFELVMRGMGTPDLQSITAAAVQWKGKGSPP